MELAGRTPPERNRYVDFLRALSIGAVVTGHWLIAAPHVGSQGVSLGHMLSIAPWTQGLSWVFQVLPVVFMVGGYSNLASWSAARRSGLGYGAWLSGRLQRLIGPLMPLLAVWAGLGLAARLGGLAPEVVKIGSQAALVPIWFLCVYVLAVLAVPLTHRAWEHLGLTSFWVLAVAALSVDVMAFAGGLGAVRWINYLFVWLAVHQLGYAWRAGRFRLPLAWAVGGLVLLVGLVRVAGYPASMVGVPGEEVSNTLPPSVAMLGLACLQCGLLLTLEPVARRWLARTTPWAAVVLVNGSIMTVYLWHLTAMVLVIGALVALGGVGLGLVPGSAAWWLTRPAWFALLATALLPFLAVFARLERSAGGAPAGRTWRLVVGSLVTSAALALLALGGIGADGALGIRWPVIALAFAGAALAGVRLVPRPAAAPR